MSDKGIDVPRSTLCLLEKEATHVTNELERLIDTLPSKFRKQVRKLSVEANHVRYEIENIKGFHWRPDPNYEGSFD